MQYRKLGKTGWDVSAIGFGAWGIGGQWGDVERATAEATIRAAHDAGMNFFDTADAYGVPPGVSEELIGQVLAPIRDDVLIASKVGNWARRAGHALAYTSPLHVVLCCDASLHRLKTNHIDLYQCHVADLQEPDVFLEAFETLKQAGKIRAYGISTNSIDVTRRFNRDNTCATVQLDYSVLNREPERELLPYCKQQNIGTIIRGPLAKGVAADKFTAETTFSDSVREPWNAGRGRERFLNDLKTVEKLRFLNRDDRDMAKAALQFVLSHEAVSTAIPGAKSPEQARANAAAGDAGALLGAELTRVREAAPV
ncbi:MAG: aldo/keto reductase [Phycisphaeraceae bacterium]